MIKVTDEYGPYSTSNIERLAELINKELSKFPRTSEKNKHTYYLELYGSLIYAQGVYTQALVKYHFEEDMELFT